MLTERDDISLELHYYFTFVLKSTVFKDMLNDVIAVLILYQVFNVIVKLI